MTTSAIFLKYPAGNCIETENDVAGQLFGTEELDANDWIEVTRVRDGAAVLIPVSNIADVVIGGQRP